MREAKAEERVIIYLDELNFTKRSLLTREWSSKNSNLSVDQEEVYVGYRSVIASMTEEKGIDHLQLHMEAINADDFIVYLKALRAKHGKRPLAMFMDRLNVHRANRVKPWYQQLNITPIYNAAY